MAVDDPHDDYAADHAVRGPDASDTRVTSDQLDLVAETRDRFACYDDLRSHDISEQRDRPQGSEHSADRGWRWKGLELDPEANRIADQAIAARREAEGRDAEGNYAETGITPVMRRIEAELEHGSLVPDTEKFALKSPDRFKEKLAKLLADEPDQTPAELCHQIHDGIRYTFIFDAKGYSRGAMDACDRLRDNGYELMVLKNTWSNDEYRGVNTRWLDKASGELFEVQFHTAQSWSAKQQTHDAYEKINDLTTPAIERERLRDFQREVASAIQAPPGWQEIETYRREGW
jgi:hypothetical protein